MVHYARAKNAFLKKDYETAAKDYCAAAERGHVEAQFDLGQMYYNGHGVSKNDQEAYVWFLIARTNCKEDETLLNRIEKAITNIEQNLTPEQKQRAQEMTTEWQAKFGKR